MGWEANRYRRVNAPVVHRPTFWESQDPEGLPREGVRGGIRTFSDEKLRVGRLLEVDVLLPGHGEASFVVRVEWVEPMPAGHAARFEVGLRLLQATAENLARVEPVLELGPGILRQALARPARRGFPWGLGFHFHR